MKKLFLIFSIMMLIFCSACTSDVNTEEENNAAVGREEMAQIPMEITDVSATEKKIFFYRDDMKIFGKLYLPEGEGPFPVVIFSNGFSGSYTSTEGYAKKLVSNGIAGVVFDFIGGSGINASDGTITDMSVLTQVADLNIVLDAISSLPEIDSNNIFLWGHSFGGLVSTYVAAQRPDEVKGLIVLEPSYQMHDQFLELYPEGSEIPDVLYTPTYIGKIFVEDILSFDIYDMMADYDKEVLLLQGTVHPAETGELKEKYFGRAMDTFPNMQLVTVEGADHSFSGSAGEEMLNLTIGFVNENMD